MKAIKICPLNASKLQQALDEANGSAATHTYSVWSQVWRLSGAAELKLKSLGLPKKERRGARAYYTSGGILPNAYTWARSVTEVTLLRRPSGWYLEWVCRKTHYAKPSQNALHQLHLTQEQWATCCAALQRRTQVTVLPDAEAIHKGIQADAHYAQATSKFILNACRISGGSHA